jgi:hypothetical protein
MKNPVMSLLNAVPEGNAIKKAANVAAVASLKLPEAKVEKPVLSRFKQQYLDDISTRMTADTLQGTSSPAASDIEDYANWSLNQGTKYSQENRNQPGYGDCSTYACKLQSAVYNRDVPSTTRGMIDNLPKKSTREPGTMSIYKTGDDKRHVVTWLPNGNVIGLGPSGVKEYPGSYYDNKYPLIGNY